MNTSRYVFRRLAILAGALLGAVVLAPSPDVRAAETLYPPARDWSWTGPMGSFDRAATQRGLQVYVEVCAACHGLDLVHYRNLTALGYSPDQIKAFAADFTVEDGPDEDGEPFDRPARPSDRFANPFPNENAARAANGGAWPPDLSLIVKSRAHGYGSIPANFLGMLAGKGDSSGADYLYYLLTGYEDEPPAGMELLEGQYYNKWYAGNAIAMPAPLSDDLVEYADGTQATVAQMSHDVSTFLAWAADPKLEERKAMGVKVMLFLIILTCLLLFVKRHVWSKLDRD